MGIRKALKKSDAVVGLNNSLTRIRSYLRRNSAIEKYLQSHSVQKLQIGSGGNHIAGWLGTDIAPVSDDITYLDASKPFPMADATFDYVFCEHMIEHITWREGQRMLRECHRILKSGGVFRVATPDLAVIIGLYQNDRNALEEKYIRWITDRYLQDIAVYKASFVINNAFRNWGHQFLYDSELLEIALSQAGFLNIMRCTHGESTHEHLQGIEEHGKAVSNQEMNVFETIILEGTKP